MQGRRYSLDDTIDVCKHFVVPEAYNAKPTLFDQLGPPVISGRLIQVMSPVQLDYKSGPRACEVCDEISDRELSPEPEFGKPF